MLSWTQTVRTTHLYVGFSDVTECSLSSSHCSTRLTADFLFGSLTFGSTCESPKELGWVSPSSPISPVWCRLKTNTWLRLPGCRPAADLGCCSPAQRWKVEHTSTSWQAWHTDWESWTERCCPLPPWFLDHWGGSSSTFCNSPGQNICDATPHIHWSTQISSGSLGAAH